jgi:hypothetical protein
MSLTLFGTAFLTYYNRIYIKCFRVEYFTFVLLSQTYQ